MIPGNIQHTPDHKFRYIDEEKNFEISLLQYKVVLLELKIKMLLKYGIKALDWFGM